MASLMPRRVYLNASARNALPALERDQDPAAVVQDVRTSAYLPSASAYEMAYLRASIAGASNLPLWSPQIAVGAANTLSDPRQTVYSVSCSLHVQACVPASFPVTVSLGVDDQLECVLVDSFGATVASGTATVAAGAYATAALLRAAVEAAVQAISAAFAAVTVTLGANNRLIWAPTATTSISVSYTQGPAALLYGGVITAGAVGQAITSNNGIGLTTMHEAAFTATSPVYFTPEDETCPVPPAPVNGVQQQWSSPFYSVFHLSTIARMWQQAAAWCYNDGDSPFNPGAPTPSSACLFAQIASWASGLGMDAALTSRPPEITWDCSSQKFAMAFDRYASASAALPATSSGFLWPQPSEAATWYLNGPSVYVLQQLACTWQPASVAAGTGMDVMLEVDRGVAGTRQDGRAAIVLVQEQSSVDDLSPVESVALVSGMGVQSEVICPTTLYDATGGVSVASASSTAAPIVTDIAVSDVSIASGSLTYLADYPRWVQLTGGREPLAGFQVAFLWKHAVTGELLPVRLAPGGSASVKVCFRLVGTTD
jgi:hypothetical protein